MVALINFLNKNSVLLQVLLAAKADFHSAAAAWQP